MENLLYLTLNPINRFWVHNSELLKKDPKVTMGLSRKEYLVNCGFDRFLGCAFLSYIYYEDSLGLSNCFYKPVFNYLKNKLLCL